MAIIASGISNYLLNELGSALSSECDEVRLTFTDATSMDVVASYSNTNGVVTKSAISTISNIPQGKTPSQFKIVNSSSNEVTAFSITDAVELTGEGEAQFGAHTLTISG